MTEEINNNLILFSFPKKNKMIYISIGLIFWLLALIFWLIPNIEHEILVFFNDLRQTETFETFWVFYTKWFIYIFGFILFGLYFASFRINPLKKYRITMFLSIILYGVGSLFVDYVLKIIIGRPRPFSIYGDLINLDDPTSLAFPSGHTYSSLIMILPMFTALIVNDDNFKTNIKKFLLSGILMLYAICMGLSRILVGVHYPSDVLFSVGLALIFSTLTISIFQKLLENKKLNNENEKLYAILFVIIVLVAIILSLLD